MQQVNGSASATTNQEKPKSQQFERIRSAIADHRIDNINELRVLIHLILSCGESGTWEGGQAHKVIAKSVGVCKRTSMRAVDRLVKKGIVRKQDRGCNPNQYFMPWHPSFGEVTPAVTTMKRPQVSPIKNSVKEQEELTTKTDSDLQPTSLNAKQPASPQPAMPVVDPDAEAITDGIAELLGEQPTQEYAEKWLMEGRKRRMDTWAVRCATDALVARKRGLRRHQVRTPKAHWLECLRGQLTVDKQAEERTAHRVGLIALQLPAPMPMQAEFADAMEIDGVGW